MKRSIVVTVAVVLGCIACSRTLSKEEAKRQLSDKAKEWLPIYCPLNYDLETAYSVTLHAQIGIALKSDHNSECMNQLIEAGLAQPAITEEKHKGAELSGILAKDGRSKVKSKDGNTSGGKFFVACGSYELGEIKSVTTEGKHASVAYAVKARIDPKTKTLTKCSPGDPEIGKTDLEIPFKQDDEGHWTIDEK